MKMTNKKILITIGIIVIVLLITIVAISDNKKQVQKSETVKTQSANNITTGSTYTTYHSNSYNVSYPNGWNQKEQKLNNNEGTVLNIQPSSDSNAYSNITVEVLNSQKTSIDTITNAFNALGYTETTSNVSDLVAKKYIGVVPTQNGNLHTTAYIFQNNQKIYYLKLEYIQSSVNEEIENEFNQVVTSFVPQ
jgi:hypothetical protein